MENVRQITGKFFYSLFFLVIIPVILWFWAKNTGDTVQLPVIHSKTAGYALMISGLLLIFWGMLALKIYGHGLPMNAYPPPVFVNKGPYKLFRHPIYLGFTGVVAGYFLFTGSASGLWLVLPVTVLGLLALVMGYESIHLKKRFPGTLVRTFFDLPENQTAAAGIRDKGIALFYVTACLLLCNFLIDKVHGDQPPLFPDFPLFSGEGKGMPLVSLLGAVTILTGLFLVKQKKSCRMWAVTSLIALGWSAFFGFLFPGIGAQYFPQSGSVWFTVPLFLLFISLHTAFLKSKKTAMIFSILAVPAITLQWFSTSSAITGMGSALLIFFLSSFHHMIWLFLKNIAEKTANSWKEWNFGKIRVINHGFYVGFAAFSGVILAGFLAGRQYAVGLLVFAIIVTLTSAVWAQVIEGSAKLKRPFGYYGGLVGILFGSMAVWAMGLNVWVIIGVVSVVMPWVQAIGRLRCLVNGCCHGSKTNDPETGIRYYHPRSRVCTISGLKGELLHPTPLYSILWLFFTGCVLMVLWNHAVHSPFIFGLYLILTGIGRFVEEAYRGEAQTPEVKGLHLYQWTAIISVFAGILMTFIKINPVPTDPGFNWESVIVATVCGWFIFFAMGVDFPQSNARFSRLV